MGSTEPIIADRDDVRLASPARNGAHAKEFGRATVVPLERMQSNVVRLRSRVSCQIESLNEGREVELTFPEAADVAAYQASVLATAGAELRDLQAGTSINWNVFPDGNTRQLRVVSTFAPNENQRFARAAPSHQPLMRLVGAMLACTFAQLSQASLGTLRPAKIP